MTDGSKLSDKLNRLAEGDQDAAITAPDGQAGRVLAQVSSGDADAVLRGMLQAIDETVLAANLAFRSDSEEEMVLTVSARRLRKLESASDALAPGDAVGQWLDPEGAEAQSLLTDIARRFAEAARGTVIVTDRPATVATGRGLSVARLTELWAPAPDDSHLPAVERFTARCGTRLKACLIQPDSEEDALIGDGNLRASLEALRAKVGSGLDEPTSEPSLALWFQQTGAPEGTAFGIARWPGGDGTMIVCVLAFATADAAAISSIFRAT